MRVRSFTLTALVLIFASAAPAVFAGHHHHVRASAKSKMERDEGEMRNYLKNVLRAADRFDHNPDEVSLQTAVKDLDVDIATWSSPARTTIPAHRLTYVTVKGTNQYYRIAGASYAHLCSELDRHHDGAMRALGALKRAQEKAAKKVSDRNYWKILTKVDSVKLLQLESRLSHLKDQEFTRLQLQSPARRSVSPNCGTGG